jgi:hemolysin activation/secretion protein
MTRRKPNRQVRCSVAGLSLLLALSATNSLPAQDFAHIAPKQPEKEGPGHVVDEGASKPIGGTGSEVLIDKLKGVRLVANPKEVRANPLPGKPGIDPGDVALAHQPGFDAVVTPYLGQPVTMNSLAHMTRSIVAFYRDHDRPVVNVYVPEQAITSGYVQVVVVESRVGKVDATGAKWFSNIMLRQEVSLRPGDPISGGQVRNDVAWVNRNPFLQADMLMAPGDAPGTTDLLLRAQDRFPLRVYAGYEDSGNRYTSDDRLLAGVNYGNLFGLGQQLSFQYTQAPTKSEFVAESGTYVIPLPWKHVLTLFGSYAATDATLASHFNSGGVNWQISGRYEIPLPATARFTESVIGGYDFKRNNNNLLFGVASVSNSTTDVDQFVLSYEATLRDDYGSTSASATGFYNPGGFSAYADGYDYSQQRADAPDSYVYGQFTLDRVTRLPFDFTWTLHGLIQESDANLLPSEQLGLGGYETVPGYEEREVNGDDGFLIASEIATPPVSIGEALGWTKFKDQLQFLGFVDYGGTSLRSLTAADVNPNTNLLGIGPGLRYVIDPYVSVRFDYGFQLLDTGYGTGEHSRGHIGVVISY